jgi:signal peptidase I
MSKFKKKKQPKTRWQKIWYFIWDDDSIWSWIVNIIIAFILIKFLVYPGLGLFFGSTHPVVAVVSGSMEHKTVHPCLAYEQNQGSLQGGMQCKTINKEVYGICGVNFDENKRVNLDFFWETCGEFYKTYNINKLDFEEFDFKNGFNTGDIMVLFGFKPEKVGVGDVIVFRSTNQNQAEPIIHRVIKVWQEDGMYYYKTKGDHNSDTHSFEATIGEDRVIGKAVFRIPFLGNIKIWFVQLLSLLRLDMIIEVFN